MSGREADEDARMVERVAREWAVPLVMEKINVPAYLKNSGLSAQQGAREVRYGFFRKPRPDWEPTGCPGPPCRRPGRNGPDKPAQGAGPTGLSGIPPVRENFYIRPCWD